MPQSLSPIAICNLSLSWLGANLITSFEDDTTESKLCLANYEPMRDSVEETYQWSFCTRRTYYGAAADPLPDSDDPLNVYNEFRFKILPDVLRVLLVHPDRDFKTTSRLHWQIEAGHIVVDQNPVYAQEMFRVAETAQFTPGFAQALAARIASELALPITESGKKQELMYSLYLTKLDEAKTLDSMQGSSMKIQSTWMKNSRQRTSNSSGVVGSLSGR